MFNKIEYYKHLKIIKEKNNNELEKKINEKNINLSKLKDEIQNKEEEHQKIKKLLKTKSILMTIKLSGIYKQNISR